MIFPVDSVFRGQEDEVGVDDEEGPESSNGHGAALLVVEFVVQVGHFVGVLFSVLLVRSVQDEPLPKFEHCGQSVLVHLEGQAEVFLLEDTSLPEEFVATVLSHKVQHAIRVDYIDPHSHFIPNQSNIYSPQHNNHPLASVFAPLPKQTCRISGSTLFPLPLLDNQLTICPIDRFPDFGSGLGVTPCWSNCFLPLSPVECSSSPSARCKELRATLIFMQFGNKQNAVERAGREKLRRLLLARGEEKGIGVGGSGPVLKLTVLCGDGRSVQYKQLLSIQMHSCLGEEELQLGEVVWAKVTGHPWWPGTVTQICSFRQEPYRIDFFNDSTHAFLGPHKVAKYSELRDSIDTHRHMVKRLRRAVFEADKAFSSLAQGTSSCPGSPSSAEAPLSLQKQLLQPPLLQESPQHHHQQQSLQQYQPAESEPEAPKTHLFYSREQRQHFVNTLLKKYGLSMLPKVAVEEEPKRQRKGERRFGRRRVNKSKPIRKLGFEGESLTYLLTRKIYSVLGEKKLAMGVRREISMSLSKQILGGGGEEMKSLFKWIAISDGRTILNFYQNWGSMQGEKDKGSNMTTEE